MNANLDRLAARWMKLQSLNPVFRRTVRYGSGERLSKFSPVLRAQGASIAVLLGLIVGIAGTDWYMVWAVSAALLISAGIPAAPIARFLAHSAVRREKNSGLLEQIWLTRIPPGEIFEGYFLGRLAPLIEWRRLLLLIFMGHIVAACGAPLGSWSRVLSILAALNFYLLADAGFKMGTLAGVKYGAAAGSRSYRLFADRDHSLAGIPPYEVWVSSFGSGIFFIMAAVFCEEVARLTPVSRAARLVLDHAPPLFFIRPVLAMAGHWETAFRARFHRDEIAFKRAVNFDDVS